MNEAAQPKPKQQLTEIVLTGGPCAGKTSSLAYLQEKLADRGIRVFIPPEVPTQMIAAGIQDMAQIVADDGELFLHVEEQMLLMQREQRQRFRELAAGFDEPTVLIFDRAEMDISSYLGPERFGALLQEHRLTLDDVRDSYDAVIHLVTAAKGAPEAYTLENNQARYETPEQAIAADERTLAAWIGTPKLRIIDNDVSFDQKLRRVLDTVLGVLGIPAPVEAERKFLLARAPDLRGPLFAQAQAIEIEQHYLFDPDPEVERRVRRRTQGASSTYYLTHKRPLPDDTRLETEVRISPRSYLERLTETDPERRPLRKTRYCFAYDSAYFELDCLPAGEQLGEELWLLEVELESMDEQFTLPPSLEIEREVTGDARFSMGQIARDGYPARD